MPIFLRLSFVRRRDSETTARSRSRSLVPGESFSPPTLDSHETAKHSTRPLIDVSSSPVTMIDRALDAITTPPPLRLPLPSPIPFGLQNESNLEGSRKPPPLVSRRCRFPRQRGAYLRQRRICLLPNNLSTDISQTL